MKYIASWSGGKDSTASIILAHEHNEPLDLIIFSEVMFDKNISGEIPEQIDFIYNKAIPIFESWGYEVKILKSKKTYMDCFNDIQTRSIGNKHPERIGKKRGFPMAMRCKINSEVKIKPIKDFFKNYKEEYIQYIGIAIDEPRRLGRIQNNKISLLEKYNYTEQMAKNLCIKYDLLSPVYEYTKRGGCWFCPNMRDNEKRHLRNYHRELWNKLLELEKQDNLIGYCFNTLTKTKINDDEERFKIEDNQYTIFDYIEE